MGSIPVSERREAERIIVNVILDASKVTEREKFTGGAASGHPKCVFCVMVSNQVTPGRQVYMFALQKKRVPVCDTTF